MPSFVMDRPNGWPIKIDRILLVSSSLEIELSNVAINPFDTGSLSISVTTRRARIQTKEQDTEASINWQSLVETLNASSVLLPRYGAIEHLQWCLVECLAGTLHWNRSDTLIDVQFHTQDRDMFAEVLWSEEQSSISMIGHGEHLFVGQMGFTPGAEVISIHGDGQYLSPTAPVSLSGEEPLKYQLDMNSIGATLEGTIPLDGTVSIEALKQQLDATLSISGKPYWQIETGEIRLSSRQPVTIEINIQRGVLAPRLAKVLDTRLTTPFLEQSTLTLSAGTGCTIGESVNCSATLVSLTGLKSSYAVAASFTELQANLEEGNQRLRATAEIELSENEETLVAAVLDLDLHKSIIIAHSQSVNVLGLKSEDASIEHNLANGKGQGRIIFRSTATDMHEIISYLQLPDLSASHGNLSLEAGLVWNTQSTGIEFSSLISASKLDVAYGEYQLMAGEITMKLAGWPRLKSTQPVEMSWGECDMGVPLEDLRMTFDLDLDPAAKIFSITGHSLNASVFSGQISSTDYRYEIASRSGYANLTLEQLDLDQILSLQEEDFQSSGKINGSVPVQVNQGKLNVSSGTIAAIDPGGFIKYSPSQAVANLVAQNEQLKVVVDTMSDFQYHSLDAELEYSPEGNLVARTALKGSNPAYENGREVHLNLKVEQNLATLLKSLRLSGELSDRVGERAKSGVSQ